MTDIAVHGDCLEDIKELCNKTKGSHQNSELKMYSVFSVCLNRTGELCNLREGAHVEGTRCLRRRSLQQAPPSTGGPAADATVAAAPAPSPSNASESTLLYFGPVPSLAVSYEVFDMEEPVRLRACLCR